MGAMNLRRLVPILVFFLLLGLGSWRAAVLLSPAEARPPSPAPAGSLSDPRASIHIAMGIPVDADPSDDHIIARPEYVLSYDRVKSGPRWVSWELNRGHFGGQARHKGHFITDESLPAGWRRAQHNDYKNSGYDRGHMVRSEDRTRSATDNDSTFLLTNVLPQRHDTNAGPWLRLEDACRALAVGSGRELFITAGPIYGASPSTIAGGAIAVPEAFYKIVVVLAPGQGAADVSPKTRVIAVIVPNAEGIMHRPWTSYRTTVREVERRTGYNFLGHLAVTLQEQLETRVDEGT